MTAFDPDTVCQTLVKHHFPDRIFYIQDLDSDKVGCFIHHETLGVAVFPNFGAGRLFLDFLEADRHIQNGSIKQVDFDQALDIAKSRPDPICAIHLIDGQYAVVDTFYIK